MSGGFDEIERALRHTRLAPIHNETRILSRPRHIRSWIRVERRRADVRCEFVNGETCYVAELAERRAYFGLFCLWRAQHVTSEHRDRIDVVVRVFLTTGHVPAQLVV